MHTETDRLVELLRDLSYFFEESGIDFVSLVTKNDIKGE